MAVPPLIRDSDVLLVVDVQNDFCAGGALAVPGGEEVPPVVNRLAARFQHMVLTQDWHPPGHGSFASAHPGRRPFETIRLPYGDQTLWPDHCVQGTPGADFHPGLETRRAELVLRKGFRQEIDSYSAFQENDRRSPTGLGAYLRERGFGRVVLAGLALDFCVFWSAKDALERGFEAIVVLDACRAIDTGGSAGRALRELSELGVELATADALA